MTRRKLGFVFLLLAASVMIAAAPEIIQPVVTDIDPRLGGLSDRFGGTLTYALGGGGQVYFTAGYATGFFKWTSAGGRARLLQSGDSLPAIPGSVLDGVGQGTQVNEAGRAVFVQTYGLKNSPSGLALIRYDGAGYEVVVRRGDDVPGAAGHKFATFGRLQINGSDVIAFEGRSEPLGYGVTGVFTQLPGGPVSAIAVDGQPAPDGGTYRNVSLIGINGAGDVAFFSQPAGGTPAVALYVRRAGATSRLATPGLEPEGAAAGCRVGPNGQVAFRAREGSLAGIWIAAPDPATVTKVVRQGDPAPVSGFPDAVWSSTYPVIHGFNANGKVLFWNQFQTSTPMSYYAGLFLWTPGAFQPVAYQSQSISDVIPGADIGNPSPGVLNDSDVVAFRTSLTTAGSLSSYALLRWSGGALSKIVQEGDAEPGGGAFGLADRANTFYLNSAGQLLFQADILNSNQGTGLFLAPAAAGPVESVVDTNDSLPADARIVLRRIGAGALASDDELLFTALRAGGKSAFYTKAFKRGTVRRIAGEGDTLPGGGVIVDLYNPMINNREEVAFTVGDEVGGLTYYSEGVYIHSPADGAIHKIAATGDPLPGGGGSSFNRPSLQGFNHLGEAVFQSDISSAGLPAGSGVFAGSVAGGARTVAKSGDTLADGAAIASAYSPAINNHGDVAFKATLGPYPYTQAVLIRTSGAASPVKVAQTGDAVSGYSILTFWTYPPRLNDLGKVAFSCALTDNQTAILLGDSAGALQTIAMTGQAAPSGGAFTAFNHPTLLLNNPGQAAFWAETDSATVRNGIFRAAPGSAPVARLVEGQALPDGGTAGPLLPGGPFTLADSGEMAVQVRNFGSVPDFARNVIVGTAGSLTAFGKENDIAKTMGGGRLGRLSGGVWTNSAGAFFSHALLIEGKAAYAAFWNDKRVP
ncbi:MAG: hypothetical protein IT158_28995 [Bryobacterales bacterium]|nr:hypothetical protein [Bryobacterales bacterium]